MSTGKKKKISAGKRKFRRFLRIYASILGIATIVVCIIVWGRLKNYQESYDNSKSKHSPDKFMNEFVDNLDYEKILGYVKNYGINVETGINPKENHAAYFAACVAADGAKYGKMINIHRLCRCMMYMPEIQGLRFYHSKLMAKATVSDSMTGK